MKHQTHKLDAVLDLRLAAADLAAFRRRAATDGIPLSTWLRIAGQEKVEAQDRKERWQRERAALDQVRVVIVAGELSGQAKHGGAKSHRIDTASVKCQDKKP